MKAFESEREIAAYRKLGFWGQRNSIPNVVYGLVLAKQWSETAHSEKCKYIYLCASAILGGQEERPEDK